MQLLTVCWIANILISLLGFKTINYNHKYNHKYNISIVAFNIHVQTISNSKILFIVFTLLKLCVSVIEHD